MTGMYILDEHGAPVPCPDTLAWGRWFEANRERRIVHRTEVGPLTVSTVFLGLDHNFFSGDSAPVLYETMIFDTKSWTVCDDYQERYSTRDQAIAGHTRAVDHVLARQGADR